MEIQLFEHQKEVKQLLNKLRKLLLNPVIHKAILLSFKLFRAFGERHDLNDRKYFSEYNFVYHTEGLKFLSTAKRVNQMFTPYVRIMELDEKISIAVKSNPNLQAYQRIKELLSKYHSPFDKQPFTPYSPEIVSTYSPLQVRNNPEALEKLGNFLRQEVDVRAPIMKAMTRNSHQETENINLETSPRVSSKKAILLPDNALGSEDKLPSEDNLVNLKASAPSYK